MSIMNKFKDKGFYDNFIVTVEEALNVLESDGVFTKLGTNGIEIDIPRTTMNYSYLINIVKDRIISDQKKIKTLQNKLQRIYAIPITYLPADKGDKSVLQAKGDVPRL